jgi:hypothetical protein
MCSARSETRTAIYLRATKKKALHLQTPFEFYLWHTTKKAAALPISNYFNETARAKLQACDERTMLKFAFLRIAQS